MDNKLDRVKQNLIQQYSKLEGLNEDQMILKLDNLDWSAEFKKLNKNLRFCKIFQGLFAVLIIVLTIVYIRKVLTDQFIIFCLMLFSISGLQNFQSKTNSKLHILGLLFEIYK